MKLFGSFALLLALAFASAPATSAQGKRPYIKRPSEDALRTARATADTLFTALENAEVDFLASWVNDKLNYTLDATSKVQKKNDYLSQFDIILLNPPDGPLGAMDGYDLIEESYLPGSDRFFRMTYLSYHTGNPLIWEFRFYVRPDGEASLVGIDWNSGNPFSYLATPDMMLNRWYENY